MSKTIYYVTGNANKFAAAKVYFDQAKIQLEQKALDVVEMQSESLEEIALAKAQAAYQQLQQPLLINDSGWFFSALNGFPGPYMKYVNKWLTPEDYLRLMDGKTDRQVILRQVVIYCDGQQTKLFSHDAKGVVLNEVRGATGVSGDRVCSFAQGMTISEMREKGLELNFEQDLWQEVIEWIEPK